MIKKNNRSFRKILTMSNLEARKFLLKHESYCNFELPKYFKFGDFLEGISKKIDEKNLKTFYKPINSPRKYDDVNHTILHNKDGKFAWRHFELINPVLYVALVHAVTDLKNWKIIVDRFKVFNKNKKIECMSLPIESITKGSDQSKQINKWWRNVEQKSIELSLDYEYIFKTDITDCYSSIYTHSIAWALHDKAEAKKRRDDKELIGNIIDNFFCDMSNGQTNGIPQGSTLTDFVSEILLGYADTLLTEKIDSEVEVKDYHIIRYRDDYRIFVHNSADGNLIVKHLCEVLIGLGLKLNPTKTVSSHNIVKYAVKEDKRFWASRQKQNNKSSQDILLSIHELAGKYPNSGSLRKALDQYSSAIKNEKSFNNIMTLIGITVDIAYNNPKVYATSAAILSKLISCIKGKKRKLAIFNKIIQKFKKIPNHEHLQIWLQRITLNIDKEYGYSEPLCRLILGEDVKIWNFEWLNDKFKKNLDVKNIVDNELIKSMPEVIDQDEVALFLTYD